MTIKTTALYDASCSLCQQSKAAFKKLDLFQKVEWISLQEYERKNKETAFKKEDLRKELHIITVNGEVLKGFYAIRKLFLLFPITLLFGVILYTPGSSFLGVPIYKVIAKNRHRFFRKKCDNGKCSI